MLQILLGVQDHSKLFEGDVAKVYAAYCVAAMVVWGRFPWKNLKCSGIVFQAIFMPNIGVKLPNMPYWTSVVTACPQCEDYT